MADMKITPVLFVEQIEKSLPFWVDRLGFEATVEVPEGGRLGFVILQREGAELMLQTWSSLSKDLPAMVDKVRGASASLFIEVDDFAGTVKRLEGAEVVVPVRDTFYGMTEIVVREPGGHPVCFACATEKAAGKG